MNTSRKRFSIVVALIVTGAGLCWIVAGCGSDAHSVASVPNAVPAITSLTPAFALGGSGGQTIVISGNGFGASSSVMFNGSIRPANVLSSQQISIVLNQGDFAVPGNYIVSVTNPPPGGGTSATATFAVWNTYKDPSTGIGFAFPQLGSTTQIATSSTSTGAVSAFNIQGWNTSQQQLVSVIGISVYANTPSVSLQQWFNSNVDINGMLVASGSFQSQQLGNGVTMLIINGPIPSQYLAVGGPVDEVYAMSPDGKYVIAMTEGQEAQIGDYGYTSGALFPQILGAMSF